MRFTIAAAAALSTLATASVHGADTPIRTNPVPSFVTLDAIEAPIMSPSRIEGRVQLSLVVEAKDAASADALSRDMPRLRATSLSTTLEYARLYASGFRALDVQALGSTIQGALKPQYPGIQRVLVIKAAATPAA